MRIGVDLGGTKVSMGLVEEHQIIGTTRRFLIKSCRDADDLVSKMKTTSEELLTTAGLSWSDLEFIGIGSPGPLDYKTGWVLQTPNLKIVVNYPLGPRLQAATGVPVLINNDANCFTLGEQKAGVGKGLEYVLGATLGTGFGLGFVYQGKIFNGATGTAFEFALTPYADGVYEDYISGRGIAKIYAGIKGDNVAPEEVTKRAKHGDPAALEAWRQFGGHLAQALITLVMVLDPDIIVIGGSLVAAWEFFYPNLHEVLFKTIHEGPRHHLRVAKSELGELAAIIGAACLNE